MPQGRKIFRGTTRFCCNNIRKTAHSFCRNGAKPSKATFLSPPPLQSENANAKDRSLTPAGSSLDALFDKALFFNVFLYNNTELVYHKENDFSRGLERNLENII